jgi:iron complex transport system substrate-binding protein
LFQQGFLFFGVINTWQILNHLMDLRNSLVKHIKHFLFCISVFSLLLGACASPVPIPAPAAIPPTAAPITLIDGLKREVVLDAPAQKIISLAPSNTELLFAVGAGPQVIGRDDLSDFPAESKALPSVGGSMGKYDMEKLASLNPDLVLASSFNTAEQVKSLEDLKIKVYYLADPTDIQGLYANLLIVGQLAGQKAQADALVASLKGRVQAVESRLASITNRPKVFYEVDATDPAKPWTTGPGTFMDQLIKLAGGENVASGLSSAWAQISLEELLLQNPEVILLGDAAYGATPDQVKQRAGWSQIKAVTDGKLLVFDDNLVSRPGPRLVDGLETLAALIHPELK